ncbi:MAG: hypothetical protein LUD72_12735, partial [Bacteroidales bacterium]|nr:hypothetical protein [Bacteroidales bacterium]
LIPLALGAQAQLKTKKAIIADFPSKITKVVMSGDSFLDAGLAAAVKDCWRLSPYEFCTLDEFRSIMGSDDYYFLLVVDTKFRKEMAPGLKMLTLIKGGKRADKGIDKMFEVVYVPVCSADEPSGRELVFLPTILDIVQSQVAVAMESDLKGYGGLGLISRDISAGDRIAFAESDVAFDVEAIPEEERERIEVLDDDDVDELVVDGAVNVLASYSIYPTAAEKGSYCYNMLIDAKSHKLCYFRRYKITASTGVGFNEEDLKKILK